MPPSPLWAPRGRGRRSTRPMYRMAKDGVLTRAGNGFVFVANPNEVIAPPRCAPHPQPRRPRHHLGRPSPRAHRQGRAIDRGGSTRLRQPRLTTPASTLCWARPRAAFSPRRRPALRARSTSSTPDLPARRLPLPRCRRSLVRRCGGRTTCAAPKRALESRRCPWCSWKHTRLQTGQMGRR